MEVDLTLGASAVCEEEAWCLDGLEETYGADLSAGFTPLDSRSVGSSVEAGNVDLGVMYATDAAFADSDLAVLEDDDELLWAENIVPIGTAELDDEHGGELGDLFAEVSGELTVDDLVSMNRRYDEDQDPADEIAAEWLDERGLVSASTSDSGGSDDDGDEAGDEPAGQGEAEILIGTQDFGESLILAEIHAQLLADAGFTTEVVSVGGFHELLYRAFEDDRVNLAFDYLGAAASHLEAGTPSHDAEETAEELDAALGERDLTAWEHYEAANPPVFVMAADRADDLEVEALSDLDDID